MVDPQIIELGKNAPWFLISLVFFFGFIKSSKWVVDKINDVYDVLFNKDDGKVIQLITAQEDFVKSVKHNNELIHKDIEVALDAIKSVEKKISYMNSIGFENMNSDYFDILFEQTPVPIAFIDSDFEIMRANDKCCEFLGYNTDEITGIKLADITIERDKSIDILQAEKVKTGEIDFYRLEKTFIRKNGENVYCTIFMYRIPSEGPFNHFIKVIIPSDKTFLTR